MTKNFNLLVENILTDLEQSASLTPVGSLTISSPPEEQDCLDCDEDIAEDISEYEIAENIIRHAKALRKKVGEESYYRIRAILDNAKQLQGLHPNIEMVDSSEPIEESYDMAKDFKQLLMSLLDLPPDDTDKSDRVGRTRLLISNKLKHMIRQGILDAI